VRALEKIMDQGARWLQDMRNQLKARQAQGADAAAQQQIAQDAARCDLLVARLKQLRIAHGAALEAAERCKGTAGRRSGLLASLQRLLEEVWKSGRQKLEAVAEQAIATGAATDGVDAARRTQQELQSALQQAVRDCEALQAQEQAAADVMTGLQPQLQAAA
jgi:CHASE3 domain sensor protein